jgi:molybdopterin-biosynthesis enzyme MoeA-like protein
MLLDILATIQENCLSVSPIVEIQMPRALPHPAAFGLIVIGDEILFGSREDRHFDHFRRLLGGRDLSLTRFWLVPDEPEALTAQLRFSMQDGMPVFVCGGIGATPDDHTRACAAAAADTPLQRHPEAAALIEQRFGVEAYPTRIQMADLPAGCELIPNPVNGIAGFSLRRHFFLPGFPQMAWPMAEWVLENHFVPSGHPLQEACLRVTGVPESMLVPLMEALFDRFEELKLYSLPHLGDSPCIELGFRGTGDIEAALRALRQELTARNIRYQEMPPRAR